MNLDTILGERLAILGGTGSGKSYTARGLAERVLSHGGRLGVIDPTGVWHGLRVRADGAAGFPVVIFGGDRSDVPLLETAGRVIGHAVAATQQSWVIDTSALKTKAAERRFMLDFLDAIFEANREDITLIVDEADRFSPQRMSPETARLHERMEEIVRRGRVKGFTPWLITQRPASLNKDVLSQATAMICLRMTGVHDRDAIADVIEGQADKATAKAIVDAMPRHKVGAGLVWAPQQDILLPAQFPKIRTADTMRAPKPGERVNTKALPPIDLGKLKEQLATVEAEAKASDPRALKAEVARLTRELAAKPVAVIDPQERARLLEDGFVSGYNAAQNDACKAIMALQGRGATNPPAPSRAAPPAPRPLPVRASTAPRAPLAASAGRGVGEVGNGGLRRILIALAQRQDGLTNRQIGVHAGLSSKSGTFSTYLSRGRSSGWIVDQGDRRTITAEGLAALGSHDPLPTGRDLLDHWLRELGDSGAARLLRAIAEAHPEGLTNAEAGERANLTHGSGTFSTYLSKLRTLELITGRGELRASEELFA